ncbi:elongation factor P [Syntrophomonas wolfei]|jgi:elongation factor P|uniref:Elongation factor P n=1 Tax=Syntrophomonas wolfei subsp. wolfei (strain DSM 2245B / Goettingen) TaxID=335541 RepID=EFP_SYNWW|nr:elongation factor P [Syntrophomonas wolfei]Q0AZH4.1 RecName: Full=Elongation factor P; Short=EF-P [Syntrophomonas wolfei subsp. wolfei str. Goettingen G311]ABI67880.1 translation elongation factor P (EF-P) [Syntrophomonas wolfei subsp. wolfei str. Goettingen G311]
MISVNDFKTGVTIELEGQAFQVVEFMHVKPGKGSAFVRAKLKNVKTGGTVEKTFRGGEKVPRAHLDKREMQYLYNDGEGYVCMDTENYEQISISKESIGEGAKWLMENMILGVLFFQGNIIGVDLPNFVEMLVVDTEPGVKGDTATGAVKNATLESGAVVQVPLFVNTGDRLRIDIRTGEYMERV